MDHTDTPSVDTLLLQLVASRSVWHQLSVSVQS